MNGALKATGGTKLEHNRVMAKNNKAVDITKQGAVESSITLFPGWLREMSRGTTGPQQFGGQQHPLTLQLSKHLGKTIEVKVTGPFEKTFSLEGDLPQNDVDELEFRIAWENNEIKLFLFDQLVDIKSADQGK